MKKLLFLLVILITISCSSMQNSYYSMEVEVVTICDDVDTIIVNTFYPNLQLSDYNVLRDEDWNRVAVGIVRYRILSTKVESVK